jgi:hypothetical protein
VARQLAAELMDHYFCPLVPYDVVQPISRTRWPKLQKARRIPLRVPCFTEKADGTQRREWNSEPVSLDIFDKMLDEGQFDYKRLNLNPPECPWLDSSIVASPKFHVAGSTDSGPLVLAVTVPLGSSFPLSPRVDREGTAVSSFQRIILKRIYDLRAQLVDTSDAFDTDEWLQCLRALVTEAVSLVDCTLHQLYFKAEFDPLPAWGQPDISKLGSRNSVRVADKLNWVSKITKNQINAKDELPGFHRIRELRNHLQHFDPPCFAFTLEDAAGWANDVLDCVCVGWAIRRAARVIPSTEMIRLLLDTPVVFAPADHSRPRSPQGANMGYSSTRWPCPTTEVPYEDEADEVGHVVMFDQSGRFAVMVDGRRIEGKFLAASEDSIKVLRTASVEEKILVRVVGRCARDRSDQLIKFTYVEHVTYAEDDEMREALDVDTRLNVLAELQQGWCDGEGEPLDTDGVEWARALLAEVVAEGIAKPYLYPMVDGGLLAEWTFPDTEVSAEFDFESHRIFLVGTKIRAMAKADAVAADASEIVAFVARFGLDGMVSNS